MQTSRPGTALRILALSVLLTASMWTAETGGRDQSWAAPLVAEVSVADGGIYDV